MSNLATTTPIKNPYLLALDSPKLAEFEHNKGMSAIITLLTQTYTVKGEKMEREEIVDGICQLLFTEIKTYFPALTIDEIKLAFAKGVRGHYGPFYGLNIVTYHHWLSAYQVDDKRLKAKKLLELPEPKIDKTKVKHEWWLMILRQFHAYKESGQLEIKGPLQQFRIFEDAGLIVMDAKTKEGFVESAKNQFKETKLPLDRKAALSIKAIISGIDTGILTEAQDSKIKSLAAQLGIQNYYDGKTEEEFENLIREIIN